MTRLALLICLGLPLFGCEEAPADENVIETTPAIESEGDLVVSKQEAQAGQENPLNNTPTEGEEVIRIKTNLGDIYLKLFSDKAPKHVENIKKLAKADFYDGQYFHRVIPGFMIQGGDPNTKNADRSDDGMGGPAGSVEAEFNEVPFKRGVLGMARSADPNSAGSQFFIMHNENPSLNGKYTAFGIVIAGMDVVDQIANLPRDSRDNPLEGNPANIEGLEVMTWPVPGVEVEDLGGG